MSIRRNLIREARLILRHVFRVLVHLDLNRLIFEPLHVVETDPAVVLAGDIELLLVVGQPLLVIICKAVHSLLLFNQIIF